MGKSNLLCRFTRDEFLADSKSTIGVEVPLVASCYLAYVDSVLICFTFVLASALCTLAIVKRLCYVVRLTLPQNTEKLTHAHTETRSLTHSTIWPQLSAV